MIASVERPYDSRRIEGLITSYRDPLREGYHEMYQRNGILKDFATNLGNYIVDQDDDLLIINKPVGVVSHAGREHPLGVEEICRHNLGNSDISLAHRIDRDTSGLLILAKTPEALAHLRAQFKLKTSRGLAQYRDSRVTPSNEMPLIEKIYIVVLDGVLDTPKTIYAGIEETRMAKVNVYNDANLIGVKDSLTHFMPHRVVRSREGNHTLASVLIVSGRKHQIRAVAEYIGFPVTGDTQYGSTRAVASRQLLHARQITFCHPTTHEMLERTAPIPTDIYEFSHLPVVKELVRR